MVDLATVIRAVQLGDSMLPAGGFSFSGGLESAVEAGAVSDVDGLHARTRATVRPLQS